jgi:hypothetical protein
MDLDLGQLKDCQFLRSCHQWNPFVNISPSVYKILCEISLGIFYIKKD